MSTPGSTASRQTPLSTVGICIPAKVKSFRHRSTPSCDTHRPRQRTNHLIQACSRVNPHSPTPFHKGPQSDSTDFLTLPPVPTTRMPAALRASACSKSGHLQAIKQLYSSLTAISMIPHNPQTDRPFPCDVVYVRKVSIGLPMSNAINAYTWPSSLSRAATATRASRGRRLLRYVCQQTGFPLTPITYATRQPRLTI
jgi:hypothetical protein